MGPIDIGFGGGCHWCTEAVFAALRGVTKVSQGYISARPPNDSFSEAVIVTYEPNSIPRKVLTEIHLRTHASTPDHKMRGKYRSAIYTFSDAQAEAARNALVDFQPEFDERLVTQVLQHVAFKPSGDRFVQYYEKNAEGPFCTRYIDPKLEMLRARYAFWVKDCQNALHRSATPILPTSPAGAGHHLTAKQCQNQTLSGKFGTGPNGEMRTSANFPDQTERTTEKHLTMPSEKS